MPAQIGLFDSLKSTAGKVFSYLASITLTGTDGKTLTVENDSTVNQDLSYDAGPTFSHLHLPGAANEVMEVLSSRSTAIGVDAELTITGVTCGIIEIAELAYWVSLARLWVAEGGISIKEQSAGNHFTTIHDNAGTVNLTVSGSDVIIQNKATAILSIRTRIVQLN
jgi:hypothetical protein